MDNPTTVTAIRKKVADGELPESFLLERLRYELRCRERNVVNLSKEIAQMEKSVLPA